MSLLKNTKNDSDNSKVYTFIVNHQQNINALILKNSFLPLTRTCLLDSGSDILPEQVPFFDKIYPNIYYSGLYNEALRIFLESEFKLMLFMTSDVSIPDPVKLIQNIEFVMSDDRVGLYGPVSAGGVHFWGMPAHTGNVREVPYVEGFCFIAHRRLLEKLGVIDTRVNMLGWGIDIALGYVSNCLGLQVLIDDRIEIVHPKATGYNRSSADDQMNKWLRNQKIPYAYHKSGQILFQQGFGRYWPVVRRIWSFYK